jgi:hypothetical protein
MKNTNIQKIPVIQVSPISIKLKIKVYKGKSLPAVTKVPDPKV